MTPDDFATYAAGASRPYALVFFCTAAHLLGKPALGLRPMRREWGVLAKAMRASETPEHASVFLATLEFEDAREAFHRLGVDTLPWVVTLAPSVPVPDDGEIGGLDNAVMRHAEYGHKHWVADDFAAFVSDRASIPRPHIAAPPPRPSIINIALGLALLGGLGAAGWRFYKSALAAFLPLWMFGACAVWWFSTSGGMYNIIRGMPMVMPQVWEGGEEGGRTGGRAAPVRVLTLSPHPSRPQRDGTIKLFLDGSSGQVGFEGYLVGTLYSSVGLAFWGLARGVPRLADEKARRAAGFALVAAAWVAYTRVVALHDWKTGFSWSWFLF